MDGFKMKTASGVCDEEWKVSGDGEARTFPRRGGLLGAE